MSPDLGGRESHARLEFEFLAEPRCSAWLQIKGQGECGADCGRRHKVALHGVTTRHVDSCVDSCVDEQRSGAQKGDHAVADGPRFFVFAKTHRATVVRARVVRAVFTLDASL